MLPRLRPEVRVESDADGPRIVDPVQGLAVRIDPDLARVIPLLDGARDAGAIVEALAAEGVNTTAGHVERALEALGGMYVLDDERGRARAAAAAAAAPAGLRPLEILPGDRFDCHACGFCCSNGQNFGPLSEADRDRALAFDWTAEIEGVRGPDDLFEWIAAEEGAPPKIFLRQRRGRCVFLTDDNLCRIHMRLGYAAKPHMCRQFPFMTARTPEGTCVSVRRECWSLERSREHGTPLERQRDAIAALAAADEDPIVIGALVPWIGPLAVPYALAAAVRRAALRALEAPSAAAAAPDTDLDARLRAVRDLVAGVSARLGARPGEAELARALAFAAARASADGPLAPPAPVPPALARAARAALRSLLAELGDPVRKLADYLRNEADHGPVRREAQEALAGAIDDVLATLEGRAAPAGDPPALSEAAGAVLRGAPRQEIHGWLIAARTPLLGGYALLPLRLVLALARARRLARERGAAEVSGGDAAEGVLLATRAFAAERYLRIAVSNPARLLGFFQGFTLIDPGGGPARLAVTARPAVIDTERLRLELPPPEAAAQVRAYFVRNRTHLAPYDPPLPRRYWTESYWRGRLETNRRELREDRALRLFLRPRAADGGPSVIGHCNFTNVIRGAFQACFLGYGLDRALEGRGLMTEALRAAIAHVFGPLKLHRIHANYMPGNARSARVLERLGFRVEGRAPDYLFIAGAWREHVLTALTNPAPIVPVPPR